MKRIGFYSLIVFQIIVLVGMSAQYYLIDIFGKPIKLSIDTSSMQYIDQSMTDLALDLSIQSITEDQWDIDESLTYNSVVYVLLEKGSDHLYEVKRASLKKFQPKDNQVQLKATYHYDSYGKHQVSYGFEQVSMSNLYELLSENRTLVATAKITPWGQHKIVELEAP